MKFNIQYHIPFCCEKPLPHKPLGCEQYKGVKPITEARRVCKIVKTNVYVNWEDLKEGFMVTYPSLKVMFRNGKKLGVVNGRNNYE